MNDILEKFARQWLKDNIKKIPISWELKFRHLYTSGDFHKPINIIIDEIHPDRLDWAMEQVQNSIKKLTKENKNG